MPANVSEIAPVEYWTENSTFKSGQNALSWKSGNGAVSGKCEYSPTETMKQNFPI